MGTYISLNVAKANLKPGVYVVKKRTKPIKSLWNENFYLYWFPFYRYFNIRHRHSTWLWAGSLMPCLPPRAGDMVYSNGSTLTILNKSFSLSDVDNMYVDDTQWPTTPWAWLIAEPPPRSLSPVTWHSISPSPPVVPMNIVQSARNLAKEITYTLGWNIYWRFVLYGRRAGWKLLARRWCHQCGHGADGLAGIFQDGKRILPWTYRIRRFSRTTLATRSCRWCGWFAKNYRHDSWSMKDGFTEFQLAFLSSSMNHQYQLLGWRHGVAEDEKLPGQNTEYRRHGDQRWLQYWSISHRDVGTITTTGVGEWRQWCLPIPKPCTGYPCWAGSP